MSLFANTKTIEAPAKGAKKATKEEIVVKGLEEVAALDAVMKSIKAVFDVKVAALKQLTGTRFTEVGCKTKKRPDNFRGIEGMGEGSCELRIRASNSPVGEEEAVVLKDAGIPLATIVERQAGYMLNPDVVTDEHLAILDKALKNVKGLPQDLFVFQTAITKTVVADNALDVLFTKPLTEAARLLPMVGVLAVKPKLKGDDAKAFEIVNRLLHPAKEGEEGEGSVPEPEAAVAAEEAPKVARGRRGARAAG